MDYHFARPKISEKTSDPKSDFTKLLRILKSFIPVFMLAALLPAFLVVLVSPPKISYFTQADTAPTLRIWIEPSRVVAHKDSPVEVSVYAQFDSESKLVPQLSFKLVSDSSLSLDNSSLSYLKPFRGKVQIGKVTATAKTTGTSKLTVDKNSVDISIFDGPVEIMPGSSEIIVQ